MFSSSSQVSEKLHYMISILLLGSLLSNSSLFQQVKCTLYCCKSSHINLSVQQEYKRINIFCHYIINCSWSMHREHSSLTFPPLWLKWLDEMTCLKNRHIQSVPDGQCCGRLGAGKVNSNQSADFGNKQNLQHQQEETPLRSETSAQRKKTDDRCKWNSLTSQSSVYIAQIVCHIHSFLHLSLNHVTVSSLSRTFQWTLPTRPSLWKNKRNRSY